MATLTFAAHCQRGHDRVDFTDRAEFERHMRGHMLRDSFRLMGATQPSLFEVA